MRFDIITIFPRVFDSYFNESIIKRAKFKKLVDIRIYNLRDFTRDKHKTVALRQAQGNREPRRTIDDKPYGGGPGMVFKVEPLARAINYIRGKNTETKIILFSASGRKFNAKLAQDFAKKYKRIILIAGHYEGVDERIKSIFGGKIEELSIGPYVLTGGELPAMVFVDAVSRHIPGVLGKEESLEEKRYGVGVPAYTRPEVFVYKNKKYTVPKVLVSGNHKDIEKWRINHSK